MAGADMSTAIQLRADDDADPTLYEGLAMGYKDAVATMPNGFYAVNYLQALLLMN